MRVGGGIVSNSNFNILISLVFSEILVDFILQRKIKLPLNVAKKKIMGWHYLLLFICLFFFSIWFSPKLLQRLNETNSKFEKAGDFKVSEAKYGMSDDTEVDTYQKLIGVRPRLLGEALNGDKAIVAKLPSVNNIGGFLSALRDDQFGAEPVRSGSKLGKAKHFERRDHMLFLLFFSTC